ncbi:ABC transporter permease [Angustibacter speluncae]
MSTTTAAAPAAASRAGRARPGRAVLAAETRLFLREPFSLFWIAGFPTLLLVVIGLVPPFREPDPGLGGLRVVDLYVPISVLLAVIMASVQAMPQVLAAYREQKVLRRVATTPARPRHLLLAQVALHGGAVLVSGVLVVAAGTLVYRTPLPQAPLPYLLALLLALAASLATGCLLGGVITSTRTAAVVGTAVFVPSMFTAGVYVPVTVFSGWLADVVALTPLGSAAYALDAAARGGWPEPVHLLVTAAWAVVLGGLAARYFRWE